MNILAKSNLYWKTKLQGQVGTFDEKPEVVNPKSHATISLIFELYKTWDDPGAANIEK